MWLTNKKLGELPKKFCKPNRRRKQAIEERDKQLGQRALLNMVWPITRVPSFRSYMGAVEGVRPLVTAAINDLVAGRLNGMVAGRPRDTGEILTKKSLFPQEKVKKVHTRWTYRGYLEHTFIGHHIRQGLLDCSVIELPPTERCICANSLAGPQLYVYLEGGVLLVVA